MFLKLIISHFLVRKHPRLNSWKINRWFSHTKSRFLFIFPPLIIYVTILRFTDCFGKCLQLFGVRTPVIWFFFVSNDSFGFWAASQGLVTGLVRSEFDTRNTADYCGRWFQRENTVGSNRTPVRTRCIRIVYSRRTESS